ncbi:MAG: hypothetical protein IKE91_07670 [Clostridia bacterium]|nr:hypothetical protein [Clostridia bacterium]
MTEIEKRLNENRAAIEGAIVSFSGETQWGSKPNAKVIEMGEAYCRELIKCLDAFGGDDDASKLCFFSDVVVRVFVAGTRYYEEIGNEELKAIAGIFNELRMLRDEFIRDRKFDVVFNKAMYVREMFLTNTISREDYDCKYRQSMIFPNFCDLYKIVHKILANWDKLNEYSDFHLMFTYFRRDWYHTEINADYHGDVFLDKVQGWKGPKPDTAIQDSDPRWYAKAFIQMLDERINGQTA